jgi:hypothetical protein
MGDRRLSVSHVSCMQDCSLVWPQSPSLTHARPSCVRGWCTTTLVLPLRVCSDNRDTAHPHQNSSPAPLDGLAIALAFRISSGFLQSPVLQNTPSPLSSSAHSLVALSTSRLAHVRHPDHSVCTHDPTSCIKLNPTQVRRERPR